MSPGRIGKFDADLSRFLAQSLFCASFWAKTSGIRGVIEKDWTCLAMLSPRGLKKSRIDTIFRNLLGGTGFAITCSVLGSRFELEGICDEAMRGGRDYLVRRDRYWNGAELS